MTDAAHNHFWEASDLQLIVVLLLGWWLDFLLPLSFETLAPEWVLRSVGSVLIVLGILVWQGTRAYMKKRDQPDGPWKSTTSILDTGPFAYSRNPIYIGIATLMLGLAFALNMPWWLLLLPAYVAILYFVQIVPEEKYLQDKFPQEWAAYKAQVRRWL